MLVSRIIVLVYVLPVPCPMCLPANVLRKDTGDGLSVWTLVIQMRDLAGGHDRSFCAVQIVSIS